MSFIGQVNLEQATSLLPDDALPTRGILFFFYDTQRGAWGFDPSDQDSWKVAYSEETPPIGEAVTQPRDSVHAFPAVALTPDLEFVVPQTDSPNLSHLRITIDELEVWFEALEPISILAEDSEPKHRLLGWPNPIQGEMQLQCALTANGLYTGNSSGYNDPRRSTLEQDACNWLLLLQVDSDDAAEMMWGDAGRLYFWIHRSDLAKRDFSRVWMISQCG